MTCENEYQFIVIDDDDLDNYICSRNIGKLLPGAVIRSFAHPEEGLEYINSNYKSAPSQYTVLFLDIHMPRLNGWDVLDECLNLSDEIKQQICIFMLSSSIAESDKRRVLESDAISGYIEKPFSIPSLEKGLAYCRQYFKERGVKMEKLM
jgi:CheY-like chemotaxis protein